MAYFINNLLCVSCGECIKVCERNAIKEKDYYHYSIDKELCSNCGKCKIACGNNAILAAVEAECSKR